MDKIINGQFQTKEKADTAMTSIAQFVAAGAAKIEQGSGLWRADNPVPMLPQVESGSP